MLYPTELPGLTAGDCSRPANRLRKQLADPARAHREDAGRTRAADWQIQAYGNTLHGFTNAAANDNQAGTVYDRNADQCSCEALQDVLDELV